MTKRDRAALLLIGWMIGFGTPFLIAGLFLTATHSKMRIEIVEEKHG